MKSFITTVLFIVTAYGATYCYSQTPPVFSAYYDARTEGKSGFSYTFKIRVDKIEKDHYKARLITITQDPKGFYNSSDRKFYTCSELGTTFCNTPDIYQILFSLNYQQWAFSLTLEGTNSTQDLYYSEPQFPTNFVLKAHGYNSQRTIEIYHRIKEINKAQEPSAVLVNTTRSQNNNLTVKNSKNQSDLDRNLEKGAIISDVANGLLDIFSKEKEPEDDMFSKIAAQKNKPVEIKKSPELIQAEKYGSDGWKAYENNELDKAIELNNKALSYSPEGWIYGNSGLIYIIKNDFDPAVDCYVRAILWITNSDDPKYYYNGLIDDLENLIKKRGQSIMANDFIENLKLIGPSGSNSTINELKALFYGNSGWYAYERKEYDSAIGYYKKSLALDDSPMMYANMGLVQLVKKNNTDAIDNYAKAIFYSERRKKTKEFFTYIVEDLQNYELRVEKSNLSQFLISHLSERQRYENGDEKNIRITMYGNYAWSAYENNDLTTAFEFNKKALSLDPNRPFVLSNQGLVYLLKKDVKAANDCYNRAIVAFRQSNDPKYYFDAAIDDLQQLIEKHGQIQEANSIIGLLKKNAPK